MSLYDILNIKRDATQSDIKKAYHNLALQYHPDKNKDADAMDRFKSIKSAYEVLSNEERRKMYDLTGDNSDQQMPDISFAFFGGDMDDFYMEFDIASMAKNVFDVLKNQSQLKKEVEAEIEDTYININAKLEDIYIGKVPEVAIKLMRKNKEYTKSFKIPLDKNRIEFAKEGNDGGNLVINIFSKPHPTFSRFNEYDLLLFQSISLEDVYKDYVMNVIHLDQSELEIKVNKNTLLETPVIKIPDHGLLKDSKTKTRGDLYVYFKIILYSTNVKDTNEIIKSNTYESIKIEDFIQMRQNEK